MSENLDDYILKRQKDCQAGYDGFVKMGAWDGWYRWISSFYPDEAHFVFELLQNAEDAKATKVKFELGNDNLVFKHNGTRDFNKRDVYSITNVGDSSKHEEANQIGKFGVGFKSVFTYTESPKIHSRTISFEIKNLFIPYLIDTQPVEDSFTTLFIFPFDRQDKPKNQAVKEIKALFNDLSDTVLLFLRNINSIEWVVNNSKPKQIIKANENEFFEINNTQKGKSNWLVYRDKIEIKSHDKPLWVSVAFSLDKNKKEILKTEGNVSIFFPAINETSKLWFHVDAPFASSVARDSIVKKSADNKKILANIAQLCAGSVHKIKKLGLLKMSFFEILPNEDDELADFYKPIYTALKEEFESAKNELIPLEKKNVFSSLDKCLYVTRQVKDTFSNTGDINVVFDDDNLVGFAKDPKKHTRIDKFISALEGRKSYPSDTAVYSKLTDLASKLRIFDDYKGYPSLLMKYGEGDDNLEKKMKWLESKSDAWLQSFYAFLDDCDENDDGYYQQYKLFIKLADGSFNINRYFSNELYFPEENLSLDEELSFVDDKTYTSGNNKKQQKKAKSFLELRGVENIDESTHIRLLFTDYEYVSDDEHLSDINRLVKFYIDNKEQAIEILRGKNYFPYSPLSFILSEDYWRYLVLEGEDEDEDAYEDKPLISAEEVFLDLPYEDTGLELIYRQLDFVLYDLHEIYQKLENLEAFLQLLKDLGAHSELKIKEEIISGHPIYGNPEWKRMEEEARGAAFREKTGTDRDWTIDHLDKILQLTHKRFEISKLLWNRLNSAENTNFIACYQKNSRDNAAYGGSLLKHTLKKYEWIPDKEKVFYKPAEISKEMLHDDFEIIDNSDEWLDHIGFGTAAAEKLRKDKEKIGAFGVIGIDPEVARLLKDLPPEEIAIMVADHKRKKLEEGRKKLEPKKKNLPTSMGDMEGSGDTKEVAPQGSKTEYIHDIEGLKDKVKKENERWSDKKIDGTKKVKSQKSEDKMIIRDFLYAQYDGHCQICGDTFKGNKDRNIFIKFPLNKKIKGSKLESDVNRKGNSLCLCPKHDKMLNLGLQTFSFTKDLDSIVSLDIDTIEQAFGPAVDVGKDYIVEENDGFYNSPEEETPFEVKAFRLPIKLFNRKFYIKFTEEHILNFIEVWISN